MYRWRLRVWFDEFLIGNGRASVRVRTKVIAGAHSVNPEVYSNYITCRIGNSLFAPAICGCVPSCSCTEPHARQFNIHGIENTRGLTRSVSLSLAGEDTRIMVACLMLLHPKPRFSIRYSCAKYFAASSPARRVCVCDTVGSLSKQHSDATVCVSALE